MTKNQSMRITGVNWNSEITHPRDMVWSRRISDVRLRIFYYIGLSFVIFFSRVDGVVPNHQKDANRAKELVTGFEIGIVPGIADDTSKPTTLKRLIYSSPPSFPQTQFTKSFPNSPLTSSPSSSRLLSKSVLSLTGRQDNQRHHHQRKSRPSEIITAKSDCCVVGQSFARMNTPCDFTDVSDNNSNNNTNTSRSERSPRGSSSGSEMTRLDSASSGRPIGLRFDRMLLRCQQHEVLETQLRNCCENEKRADAIRKCRQLPKSRERRLCSSSSKERQTTPKNSKQKRAKQGV